MDPKPGADAPLQFVDFDMGRDLVPYTVPQTLVLGNSGRLLWYQVGEMSQNLAEAGLQAIHGMN